MQQTQSIRRQCAVCRVRNHTRAKDWHWNSCRNSLPSTRVLRVKISNVAAAKGLNETHYDRVMMHLEVARTGLWVEQTLIDEIIERMTSFRVVFEEVYREYVTGCVKDTAGSTHLDKVKNGAKQAAVG